MGKETIIYRDTREKVDKVKYERKPGAAPSKFALRRQAAANVGKKNISKKDSDKIRRFKESKMASLRAQKSQDAQNSNALKKL